MLLTLKRLKLHKVPQPRLCLPTTNFGTISSVRSTGAESTVPRAKNVFKSKTRIEHAAIEKSAWPVQTPTPCQEPLSIVFTDIVKSTALWENDVEAMASAMLIHDRIVRSSTKQHDGYEVKQTGDGFMIAFPTAIAALRFCLAVQQQLLDEEWPEHITQLKAGMEQRDSEGNVLFRGLRLRMSAHWGTPVAVWNHVAERMDYLGPMVNRAARFLEVTEGGQIVISEEFLLEVQSLTTEDDTGLLQKDKDNGSVLVLRDLHPPETQKSVREQRFEVRLLGKHQFKGIPESPKLYFVIPQSLSGRLELWPKHKYVQGSKGNIIPSTT